tara:strand:- start:46 stop:213 length:168 start_codon:yes stop_codon:yes gene_type:complete
MGILDYSNTGSCYPDPPEDKGFEQMCFNCHKEYDTAHSTAYDYEKYCSEGCEGED